MLHLSPASFTTENRALKDHWLLGSQCYVSRELMTFSLWLSALPSVLTGALWCGGDGSGWLRLSVAPWEAEPRCRSRLLGGSWPYSWDPSPAWTNSVMSPNSRLQLTAMLWLYFSFNDHSHQDKQSRYLPRHTATKHDRVLNLLCFVQNIFGYRYNLIQIS